MHTITLVVKLLHGQWFVVYIHIQDATVSTKLHHWDVIVVEANGPDRISAKMLKETATIASPLH